MPIVSWFQKFFRFAFSFHASQIFRDFSVSRVSSFQPS
jgi:hypothetical protein